MKGDEQKSDGKIEIPDHKGGLEESEVAMDEGKDKEEYHVVCLTASLVGESFEPPIAEEGPCEDHEVRNHHGESIRYRSP